MTSRWALLLNALDAAVLNEPPHVKEISVCCCGNTLKYRDADKELFLLTAQLINVLFLFL